MDTRTANLRFGLAALAILAAGAVAGWLLMAPPTGPGENRTAAGGGSVPGQPDDGDPAGNRPDGNTATPDAPDGPEPPVGPDTNGSGDPGPTMRTPPEPLPAGDPRVVRLLGLLRAADYATVVRELQALRSVPREAWALVAGALAAAAATAERGVLVGLLTGEYPELAWLARDTELAPATGALMAGLLTTHPHWLNGGEPGQARVAVAMLAAAATPFPAGAVQPLVAAIRGSMRDDVEAAVLHLLARQAADAPDPVLARALLEMAPTVRQPDAQAHLLAAAWLAAPELTDARLADAVATGGPAAANAAVQALAIAWELAGRAPDGELLARVIDTAVTGQEAATGALALLTATADALPTPARESLTGRLADRAFDPAPRDAHMQVARLDLLATLAPADGALLGRLRSLVAASRDRTLQSGTVGVIGRMDAPAAGQVLQTVARDTRTAAHLREAAATALGARARSRAAERPAITAALAGELHAAPAGLRTALVRALGTAFADAGAGAEVHDRIRATATTDADPAVRVAALTALADCTPADRRAATAQLLATRAKTDPSQVVRNAADRARRRLLRTG